MRMQSFPWALIFLTAFIPAASATDRIVIGNVTVPKAEQNSSSLPFSTTIIEDGKLIAKTGPVFTEGGDYSGMVLPYLASSPKPIQYPRWAINQGWQGRLVMAIEILTDGTVGRYKVMKSTGHRMLDSAATDAVRTWKFKPAIKDGNVITTCIEIPVTFELGDL